MAEKLVATLKAENMATANLKSRLAELTKTFKSNQLFIGYSKTYQPLNENGDQLPPESKELVTTTKEELSWLKEVWVDAVSKSLRKEATNCVARADLTLFGQTFEDVPATALLNLENKLRLLKAALLHVPTLDPNKKWEVDNEFRQSFKVVPDDWKYRTQKVPKSMELSPATDKHKAQVEIIHVDENTGKWITRITSGGVSSSEISEMLKRVDRTLEAVVSAREEANMVETEDCASGLAETIFEGITGPLGE